MSERWLNDCDESAFLVATFLAMGSSRGKIESAAYFNSRRVPHVRLRPVTAGITMHDVTLGSNPPYLLRATMLQESETLGNQVTPTSCSQQWTAMPINETPLLTPRCQDTFQSGPREQRTEGKVREPSPSLSPSLFQRVSLCSCKRIFTSFSTQVFPSLSLSLDSMLPSIRVESVGRSFMSYLKGRRSNKSWKVFSTRSWEGWRGGN